jgi:predicted permease
MLRNIRYALRVLARTPAFTVTIVATLAIVIGANATVFSLIDAVLLKPLPFPDADRLVLLSESREGAPISNTAPVRIEEWNEASSTLEAITGYYTEDVSETSGDLPERFRLARVAPRFHEVWGVAPALGRGLTPADSQVGASSVVLISDRFWRARLGADPNVTGRSLRLGDEEVAIAGVMPASFRFHDADVDLWAPRVFFPWMSDRNLLWYSAFGRLKPGVSVEQARADLELVQAGLAERYPETDRDVGIYMAALKDDVVGGVRSSLFVVFGAVSLLLLIATTNIAALLLSRAAQRKQEIAVRLSLGASRGSVLAHSFTETAVLAVIGAALGLFIAAALSAGLRAWVPDLPRIEEVVLGGAVLPYTAVAVVVVTLLCGLLPAIRTMRTATGGLLGEARRTQVSGRHSLQWLFVGVQVTLAVVLLAGSGLLIRSFLELSRVEPGFEPNRILSFRVSGSYVDFEQFAPRVEGILDELRALPGVEAVASSAPVPGVLDDGSGFQFGLAEFKPLEGRTDDDPRVLAEWRVVSPSYFGTMQIPLLSGDLCGARQSDPNVMVNMAFAARYFGASPVGRNLGRIDNDFTYRIAGVVGDSREFALNRAPVPTVYACRIAYANPALAFLVRTRGDPTAMTESVRTKIKQLEPLASRYDVAPLAERIGNEIRRIVCG